MLNMRCTCGEIPIINTFLLIHPKVTVWHWPTWRYKCTELEILHVENAEQMMASHAIMFCC